MTTDPSTLLAGIPQDPSVILEHIRDGAESEITHPDDECGVKAGGFCTPHGALAAVAAVEAVLNLIGPPADLPDEFPDTPLIAVIRCDEIRDAITAALTREEAGDG